MWSTHPDLFTKSGMVSTASCSLFALIHRPTHVSHRCHPACMLKSFLLASLVVCCLLFLGWFGFVWFFVVWHFHARDLFKKAAQADLCISCINGGSTCAKKNMNQHSSPAGGKDALPCGEQLQSPPHFLVTCAFSKKHPLLFSVPMCRRDNHRGLLHRAEGG